ncbi:golgin subfamily A member 2 [Cimex lectularius]|uniref:Golgin subfamily A conserved domain-containing protein n=1 Tax=Cimex lectularius TaxID=79782 RepID=A0A8I6TIN1_CIMLE|nr:golgin subfamily A member 2 [Cimex lectularius]
MAETSKAEKLAAAKRMLKEFQQKNKEQAYALPVPKPQNNGVHAYSVSPGQANEPVQNGHTQKTPSSVSSQSGQQSPALMFRNDNSPADFFDNIQHNPPPAQPLQPQRTEFIPLQQQRTDFTPLEQQRNDFNPLQQQREDFNPFQKQRAEFSPYQQQRAEFSPYQQQRAEISPYHQQRAEFSPYQQQRTDLNPLQQQKTEFLPLQQPRTEFTPLHPEGTELLQAPRTESSPLHPQRTVFTSPQGTDSSPSHVERTDHSVPVYNFYNPIETLRDYDRAETSSTSSPSEDEATRRVRSLEAQLSVEVSRREDSEKHLRSATERIKQLEWEVINARESNKEVKSAESTNHAKGSSEESLEEEIKINLKTIQILVSQKSNLQQELATVQDENKLNKSKCEELSVRTKALRMQVAKLEQELSETAEARHQHNSILKKLELNLAEARNKVEEHKKEVEDAQNDIRALNHRIEQCQEENEALKKALDVKEHQLSMAEVKMAQTGVGSVPTAEDVDQVKSLSLECERLKGEIESIQREKSELNLQYQEYINSLNTQIQIINEEKETLLREKNEKIEREEVLVRQLGELEKQMTRERQAGPSLTTTNTHLSEKLKESEEKLALTETKLSEKISECENVKSELQSVVQRLNEAEDALERLEIPDAKKLEEAMESDRVAASRAIEQNTKLKQQVSDLTAEISETVVRLNNEKLDLTEKLQHSEYIVKELKYKMEKLKHYEELTTDSAVTQTPVSFYADQTSQTDVDDLVLPMNYDHVTPEAMQLLEKKLKKTMDDVANLTDEKQKLEHLVTQLQGETETICEYVTLYQNQRGLLQEKATERERQLAALAKEREELKMKLAQINSLLPKALPGEVTQTGESTEPVAATQIKTLLTEIESSSLVQNMLEPTTFHPCILCSGKLITV